MYSLCMLLGVWFSRYNIIIIVLTNDLWLMIWRHHKKYFFPSRLQRRGQSMFSLLHLTEKMEAKASITLCFNGCWTFTLIFCPSCHLKKIRSPTPAHQNADGWWHKLLSRMILLYHSFKDRMHNHEFRFSFIKLANTEVLLTDLRKLFANFWIFIKAF